ncbi:MAG: hypothetical protein WBH31_11010 [Promethearchaeia archaeon]
MKKKIIKEEMEEEAIKKVKKFSAYGLGWILGIIVFAGVYLLYLGFKRLVEKIKEKLEKRKENLLKRNN